MERPPTSIIARFLSIALVAAALGAAHAYTPQDSTEIGALYVMTVEGMTCAVSCAPTVQKALSAIPGVRSAVVDFNRTQAVVRMKQGQALTAEECDASFNNAGYFVSDFRLKGSDPS